MHPQLLQLLPADAVGLLGQRRVPGGAHPQVHRQQVAVQGLMAVGALGAHQHGDAEPGVLHHIPLHLVVGLFHVPAVQPVGEVLLRPGVRPVQAVQHPQPAVALHLGGELRGQGDLLPLPGVRGKPVQPLVHLPHLFPQAQPGQQVFRPLPGAFRLILEQHTQSSLSQILIFILYLYLTYSRTGAQV